MKQSFTLRLRNRGPLAAVALLVCAACTGSFDAAHDPGGGAPTSGGPGATPGSPGSTPGSPGATPGSPGATPGGPGGGGDPGTPITSAPVAAPRLARLSHRQYENTVRDLLRMTTPPGLAATFVTEPVRGTFDNAGGLLQVSPGLWLDYQRAAEAMAADVVKDPKRLMAILPANLPADTAARARTFVEQFGLRAYRRPLTTPEIDQLVGAFNQGAQLVASGNAFNDGVQMVVTVLLQSPHFLYRSELSPGAAAAGKVPLDSYEVASKLSYALVNTMPDDALFMAAAAKTLTRREGVLEQAQRLLQSPAAKTTIEDFHAQLLDMIKYDHISKDAAKFPEYKAGMGALMKTETLAFIEDVLLKQDKGLGALLLSSYTFLSAKLAPLAPLYGVQLPAGTGDALVRVDLDPTKRAGLLTQVGFLSAFADGSQPQTILRGAFVNHALLCQKLPPPPDAFTLPPSMGRTNRQRIESATHAPACAGCHLNLINPPGFGLEGYDALGKHRTMDGTQPVDTRSSYPFDGMTREFNGGVELSRLVAESRQAHDCYAHHWLEYLYGRPIEADTDVMLAAQLGLRSQKGAASLKALILEMVSTDAFLTRTP